jgi:hypothetical protein
LKLSTNAMLRVDNGEQIQNVWTFGDEFMAAFAHFQQLYSLENGFMDDRTLAQFNWCLTTIIGMTNVKLFLK